MREVFYRTERGGETDALSNSNSFRLYDLTPVEGWRRSGKRLAKFTSSTKTRAINYKRLSTHPTVHMSYDLFRIEKLLNTYTYFVNLFLLLSYLLAILQRARWICDGTAMRSKRFPRYNCFEGTWSKKIRFSLLSKFYSNRPQMRANVFYSRCEKDLNGSAVILVHHETRHVLLTRQLERP